MSIEAILIQKETLIKALLKYWNIPRRDEMEVLGGNNQQQVLISSQTS